MMLGTVRHSSNKTVALMGDPKRDNKKKEQAVDDSELVRDEKVKQLSNNPCGVTMRTMRWG